MKGLWIAVGVMFIVTGALETMMFLLSIFGILVGGVMTFGDMPGSNPEDEALAPVILGMYLVWFVITAVGATVHLWGGIEVLRGRTDRTVLLWAGVVMGFVDVLTCYCAVPGIGAAVVALVALLMPDEPAGANGQRGDASFDPTPDTPGDAFAPPRR